MTYTIPTEKNISQLYITGDKCTYEVPIYQRNYAWGKDEINSLVQDVYDSIGPSTYYIGTLVTFHKGDNVFEVIDGQQRLTTIRLILSILNTNIKNILTYRARKKSDYTLKKLSEQNADLSDPKNLDNFIKQLDDPDNGIINGLKHVRNAIDDIVGNDKEKFRIFFLDNVHIIHYQVPRDIDLNHYFEVMNSRGEQLEKHEIVKAQLMQKLSNGREQTTFNSIWQACSQMSVYVQQAAEFEKETVFTKKLDKFVLQNFDDLAEITDEQKRRKLTINAIIKQNTIAKPKETKEIQDTFLPIIDFPNFLLIVLKIMLMKRKNFNPQDIRLDDKYLVEEFREAQLDRKTVKEFAYTLLKSKYLLDNYIVHHTNEEDTDNRNPWQLQTLCIDKQGNSFGKNLCPNDSLQHSLVHLLSMFEVSFTARQRKNYLFYILLYLNGLESININEYHEFVLNLADQYCDLIYLGENTLNDRNTPLPGCFDNTIIPNNEFIDDWTTPEEETFNNIYGDGTRETRGIHLFVFNYCDYKIWRLYQKQLRGQDLKPKDPKRIKFFEELGCKDFGVEIFKSFYFSRTRSWLEHFYPQATADGEERRPNENQINCFGNFAMISPSANIIGSDWDPAKKIVLYSKDASGKITRVGVSSLKFKIMMQICKDNDGEWGFDEIKLHQAKMVELMLRKDI